MASANKTEANRRNAQKSSGPKSAEGKSRSRLNALKHGMRANLLVLPGEDAEACQGRVDAWTDSLKPRNEAEDYLAQRAARLTLQLDRIERAYVARVTADLNNAAADAAAGVTQPEAEGEDVRTLGWRLFWDARGSLSLYPHYPISSCSTKPIVSWSDDVDDPNNPGKLVFSLESTAAGCRWLLDRWAELRALLDLGQAWRSPDKLKATRLLGRQPVDALYDRKVGLVFVACHQIDPSGGELFHEIWYELKEDDRKSAKKRVMSQPLNVFQPQSEVEARQVLFGIVDQAVGRLETLAEAHRKRAEANAGLTADLLAFDGSVEGERLRRYETSCSRTLLRTLDAYDKRHRAADDDDREIDPVVPASIDECEPVSVSAAEVEPDVEINPAFAAESINEPIDSSAPIADNAISQPAEPVDAGMQSHCEPDTTHENAELPNEPTAPISPHHNPELPNEPNALISPHHGGGREQIESGPHRGDWGKIPIPGPNRRERRARRARSPETERDLTSLLPPRNRLTWKPPP
jgi:hypothetical protein